LIHHHAIWFDPPPSSLMVTTPPCSDPSPSVLWSIIMWSDGHHATLV
jgi:hypothetical protein